VEQELLMNEKNGKRKNYAGGFWSEVKKAMTMMIVLLPLLLLLGRVMGMCNKLLYFFEDISFQIRSFRDPLFYS